MRMHHVLVLLIFLLIGYFARGYFPQLATAVGAA